MDSLKRILVNARQLRMSVKIESYHSEWWLDFYRQGVTVFSVRGETDLGKVARAAREYLDRMAGSEGVTLA